MKTIKYRNGLIYTHIPQNGVTRVEVQTYDDWEARFMQQIWWEKVKQTISVL